MSEDQTQMVTANKSAADLYREFMEAYRADPQLVANSAGGPNGLPIANYHSGDSSFINREPGRMNYQRARIQQALIMMQGLASQMGMGRRPTGLTANDNSTIPFDLFRGIGGFFNYLIDGARNIDLECGYPEVLTPYHYTAMYDREGTAKRVVECEPNETWVMDPKVYEDVDPTKVTPFEEKWEKFERKHNIWHHLHRLDVLSGIGQYGVLLFGLDDEQDWAEPVEGINDDGTFNEKNTYKLNYLRPFDESVVRVVIRENDIHNPRYGLPILYSILYRDYPSYGTQSVEIVTRMVHWTRVLHAADNLKMSPIYGIPRQQQVYNRLYDLRKVYASSGEAFWKGAFPGLAFETRPEVENQGPLSDQERDDLKKMVEEYQAGLQRYLAVGGMTVKPLPLLVTPPGPTTETYLKSIALTMGIPFRVLFGSEEAKLASDQDSRAWERRLTERKGKYVTPMLIRPFIDRSIAYGLLPKPKDDYYVEWPDTTAPTEKDQATIALTVSQALAQYVQSQAYMVMEPLDYFEKVLRYDREEAEKMLGRSSRFNATLPDMSETDETDDTTKTGGSKEGSTSPPTGSALETPNLARKTTAGTATKGGRPPKQIDAIIPMLPSLMSSGQKNGNGRQR